MICLGYGCGGSVEGNRLFGAGNDISASIETGQFAIKGPQRKNRTTNLHENTLRREQ